MSVPARCPQCGASWAGASCEARFAELLALDHSRQEPWGSRHGLAFAIFALLQHPASYEAATLDRAWTLLWRVSVAGDDYRRVFAAVAGTRIDTSRWDAPARRPTMHAMPAVTIVDLGAFDAETYAERVEAWGRATIAAWE